MEVFLLLREIDDGYTANPSTSVLGVFYSKEAAEKQKASEQITYPSGWHVEYEIEEWHITDELKGNK